MAVDVEPGAAFRTGPPRAISDDGFSSKGVNHTGFDVAADGRLLLVRAEGGQARPTVLHVVQHWLAEVTRLLPLAP